MRFLYLQPLYFLLFFILLKGCYPIQGYDLNRKQPQNLFYYKGINFGDNHTTSSKQGIKDGCRTAQGFYTKDSKQFNTPIKETNSTKKSNNKTYMIQKSYKEGWFLGRSKCMHLFDHTVVK